LSAVSDEILIAEIHSPLTIYHSPLNLRKENYSSTA